MINNLTYQWALKYVSLGWSIIPLHPRSKTPLIPWQEFQKRKASMTEVESWLCRYPQMNIGVVTGHISGIVVVDLDGVTGRAFGVQNTVTSGCISLTGNGKQVLYKWTEHVDNSVSKLAPGVDIRGDGGYVVVAPSIHPNGKRYRWERFIPTALAPFPTSVMTSTVSSSTHTETQVVKKPDGWIAKALEEMKIGNIDNTLVSVLGRLRHDGYSESDARALLEPAAKQAGATEGHLEDKIRNVWGRYAPRPDKSVFAPTERSVGGLVLHSPTNPDSLIEYNKRQLESGGGDNLSTGYRAFDTLTKGLRKGEVLTVAARTGCGKSTFILTPVRTFCEAGKRVLLCSTEMSFDQIWQRYIPTLTNPEAFKSHAFFVCDEFTPDIERIEEMVRTTNPDLFIFDHVNHMSTDYHIISKFMSEIKRLARLFNIPAIVTAQLNRSADYVENGQRIEPRLSMIQGSDQIGQMSAQVLLLNEKRVSGGVTELEGIIAKNRHGEKGMIQFGLFTNPLQIKEI